jgi:hypothetical protein
MTENTVHSPVYRYFTVDLLSDEILQEIPFRGVSYQRAIKGAGSFQGSIPVISDTEDLDLYENTMPGNTAVFIVRDGECVWGGIIWSRSYNIVERVLQVNASEFTSYFYHRRIWKTISNAYSGTLVVNNSLAEVTFDDGYSTTVDTGSSVLINFDSAQNIKYDGYYSVASRPVPTSSKFYLREAKSVQNVAYVTVSNGLATIETETHHHFNVGDTITVNVLTFPEFNGTFVIKNVDSRTTKTFMYDLSIADRVKTPATGTASRALPEGVYPNSTITTRTDTYDYVRSLISAVAGDFTGSDFSSNYIEPGIRKYAQIISKEINSGVAIIETDHAHEASVGQSIQISDLGAEFDGEHRVSAILSDTKFSYPLQGYYPKTTVSAKTATISAVRASNMVATVVTSAAHGYVVGNTVTMSVEQDLGDFADAFNGTFTITGVPSTTTYQYDITVSGSLPWLYFTRPLATYGGTGYDITSGSVTPETVYVTLTARQSSGYLRTVWASGDPNIKSGDTITISGSNYSDFNGTFTAVGDSSNGMILYGGATSLNLSYGSFIPYSPVLTAQRTSATLYTETSMGATVGQTVAVSNANVLLPIAQKSYDAGTGTATIVTSDAHGLQTGDNIDIFGLRDTAAIVSRQVDGASSTKTVTLSTDQGHNFRIGDQVTVSDLIDQYDINYFSPGSSVVSTSVPPSISAGDIVTISGLTEFYTILRAQLQDGLATLTVYSHNVQVNQEITVSTLKDTSVVSSKEIYEGTATLNIDGAHNFVIGDVVRVSGVDSTFDGEYKLTNVTDYQIQYELATEDALTEAKAAYAAALKSAVDRKVKNPQSDKDVIRTRNDVTRLSAGYSTLSPTASSGTVTSSTSVFNGTFRVSAVTPTTVSYAVSANDVVSHAITAASYTVTSGTADATTCTLTITDGSTYKVTDLAIGDKIHVGAGSSRFDGTFLITGIDTTAKTVTYSNKGTATAATSVSGGSYISLLYEIAADSSINGQFPVTAIATGLTNYNGSPENLVYFSRAMSVVSRSAIAGQCTVTFTSKYPISVGKSVTIAGMPTQYNGTVTVKSYTISGTTTTVVYDKTGATAEALTTSTGTVTNVLNYDNIFTGKPLASGDPQPILSVASPHNGTFSITAVTRNSFQFSQTVSKAISYVATTGSASVDSIFNVSNTAITVPSSKSFTYSIMNGPQNNVLETQSNQRAFVNVDQIFNGTQTITAVDNNSRKFTFRVTPVRSSEIPLQILPGYGHATVTPAAIVSTFGPYPGSADIGIEVSTQGFSGRNITPTVYRGFELKVVGDVLNSYADNIDGFEYRVDCRYDADKKKFRKIFTLIPINFPAPPAPGEVSPASRFGADKLVFEYPGNISNVTLNETAEHSATRFFALGENDLGPNAGPPFSVDASEKFLNGLGSNRPWPLLDADVKVNNVYDQSSLYTYANRYLTEARPPDGQFTVSVNGSLVPYVGSYNPGDWCSVIVNDKFVLQRLANDIELRDTVLIRKIDSIRVTVPDGTTFPESVELTLIPEWEVDKIG